MRGLACHLSCLAAVLIGAVVLVPGAVAFAQQPGPGSAVPTAVTRDDVIAALDDFADGLSDFQDETETKLATPAKAARACLLLALEYIREENAIGAATAASGAKLAAEVALFIVKGHGVTSFVFRQKCLDLQNPELGKAPFSPLPFSVDASEPRGIELLGAQVGMDALPVAGPQSIPPSLKRMLLMDLKQLFFILIFARDVFEALASLAAACLEGNVFACLFLLPFLQGAHISEPMAAPARALPMAFDPEAFVDEVKTELNAMRMLLFEIEATLIDAQVLVNACVNNLLEGMAAVEKALKLPPVPNAEPNLRGAASAFKRCERDLSRLIRIAHQIFRLVKQLLLETVLLEKKFFLLVPIPAVSGSVPIQTNWASDSQVTVKVYSANGALVYVGSNGQLEPMRLRRAGMANGTYFAVTERVDRDGKVSRVVKPIVLLR